MLGRHFVVHSQLSVGRSGAIAYQNKLLLRQGENDMACGHHCVLMALMLLGQVSRDALYESDLDARLMEVSGVVAQMPVAAEVGSGDERDELGSG